MSVYLDSMGHLAADTENELHAFAQAIGMRRDWYQGPPEHEFWHYDCMGMMRRRAIEAGAIRVSPYELVERHPHHAVVQARLRDEATSEEKEP
jgi:hypothetical protein